MLAYRLVNSGVCDCSLLSDGTTFCQTDKGTLLGKTLLNTSGDKKQASIKFETSVEEYRMLPYASETWMIGAKFLYSEERQVTEGRKILPLYLRAFLKPIKMVKDEERISTIYPIVVVYKTGVVLVEFRTISPGYSIHREEFVDKYINLLIYEYDYAEVVFEFSLLAIESYKSLSVVKQNILSRINILFDKNKYRASAKYISKKTDDSDFPFEMIRLPSLDTKETLESIAWTILGITELLIRRPKTNISFILSGILDQPGIGNYWICRPHIHLIRHSNQKENSVMNEATHKDTFARILSYVKNGNGDFTDYLSKNPRRFDDYAVYSSFGVTLWVWSRRGASQLSDIADVNRDQLVYENQFIGEIIDYGYMLNKKLFDKTKSLTRYKEMLVVRRDLLDLQSKMSEVAKYGEVRTLLEDSWEQMGVSKIQFFIKENLSFLEAEIKYEDAERADKNRYFLAVFTLIASAPLSQTVVGPCWRLLRLWLPISEEKATLFLVFVSAILILFVLTLYRRFIKLNMSK